MNKQLAFTMVGTFAFAALVLTISAAHVKARNAMCKFIMIALLSFMWICIAGLLALTLMYE